MNFDSLYEELFYKTLRIRLIEERIVDLYPSDKIQSPVHLSIGQEAVAAGICQSLLPTDLLFTSYRGHAYYLAKGGNINEFFAELYGKATGCCHGKGGSMHLAAPEVGLMGASAVVASTIPHAVGAALAAKKLNKNHIVVSVFGDGAVDEGVYHESLNFAALHKLPIIFICENNGFAVHSRLNSRQAFEICEHAAAYGIPVHRCMDGYDFMKIHEIFSEIVSESRTSKAPQFIEIKTYRYMEHVGTCEDYDSGYRSRSEVNAWKQTDPLIYNLALITKFKDEIVKEIDKAIEFAENSPWPAIDDLLTDVI
jgi:pyruvate dehydrogenase E1 component alpha subunit